jgi:hypothetical protein
MERRRLKLRTLLGVGLLGASPAAARPPEPDAFPAVPAFVTPAAHQPPARPAPPAAECDRPTNLPPLLPVPPGTPPAPPPDSRGPAGEYDHGHLYLPERAPEMARAPDPACGPAGRFWVAPSLELGWTKAVRVPALLRLGTPTGPVVYGNEALNTPFRAGLGLTGGFWLDARHTHGFDASFYHLAQGGTDTVLFSTGVPLLLPTGRGGTFPLTDPGAGYAGAYQSGVSTRFAAADVNYRRNLFCGPDARLDGLAGYRYGHVGEDFSAFGKRLGPGGEIVRFRDDATAVNNFHGGQIGLAGEYRIDHWFVAGSGKVAFGTVFTDTELNGKFRVNGTVIPFGFYARPGLTGEREETRFGVMPTVGVTLGRQLGDHARVFVGYNFLYLNNLTRGGDIVDPTPVVAAADPFRLVPPTANRRDATTSDFWAQSVSAGVELRY